MACTVHIICWKWVIDGLWDSGCVVQGAQPAVRQKKFVCSHSDSKNSTLERWSKERTVRPRQLSSLNSEGWTLTALTQPNCQTNIKCIRWWTSQAQKWLKAKQRWYQKASCSSMFWENAMVWFQNKQHIHGCRLSPRECILFGALTYFWPIGSIHSSNLWPVLFT